METFHGKIKKTLHTPAKTIKLLGPPDVPYHITTRIPSTGCTWCTVHCSTHHEPPHITMGLYVSVNTLSKDTGKVSQDI